MQVQSEVANTVQNMTLQSEHVEAMLFGQNMMLQSEHVSSGYDGYVQRSGQNLPLQHLEVTFLIITSPNPKTSFKQPAVLL